MQSKTIRSVLEAAETSGLRVLRTPSHKVKGDHNKRSDAVNDIGIYLDTEAALKESGGERKSAPKWKYCQV